MMTIDTKGSPRDGLAALSAAQADLFGGLCVPAGAAVEADLSISELLLRAGYSHKRAVGEGYDHAIHCIATGEFVGLMDAGEAVNFLSSLKATAPIQSSTAAASTQVHQDTARPSAPINSLET